MSHTQVAAKDVGSAANLRRRSGIFMELTSSSLFHMWTCDDSPPVQRAVVPSTGLSIGPSGSGICSVIQDGCGGWVLDLSQMGHKYESYISELLRSLGELLPETLIFREYSIYMQDNLGKLGFR